MLVMMTRMLNADAATEWAGRGLEGSRAKGHPVFRDDFFQTLECKHVYKPGRHSAWLKNPERPAFEAFYWWLVWSLMWESSELVHAII